MFTSLSIKNKINVYYRIVAFKHYSINTGKCNVFS